MKKMLVIVFLFLFSPVSSFASPYLAFEDFGGKWYDADKYIGDSYMCWATSISNVLMYTGWNAGYEDEDSIMSEFRTHFKNAGNYGVSALTYWFSGLPEYNTLKAQGGGGYYKDYSLGDYLHHRNIFTSTNLVSDIDNWLHLGYGIDVNLSSPFSAHALTAYGIEYKEDGADLWVVDGNDRGDKLLQLCLKMIYVEDFNMTWWVVQNGTYTGWSLNTIVGLEQNSAPVPEPATMVLLSCGLFGFACRKKKKLLLNI